MARQAGAAGGMKACCIDSASPEYQRLRGLLDGRDRDGLTLGTAAVLALLAQGRPDGLYLVQAAARPATRDRLCVRVRDGLQQVPVGEVRYFLAEHKYVWVRTAQTRLLIRDSLCILAREYAGTFLRIHRNALVATRYLTGLAVTRGGAGRVRLAGIDEALPVSRRRLAAVRRILRAGQENPDVPAIT